ncbi:Haloacid dehalogenase-like hydrolase domain-containing protein 2 [Coemansia sp. BCRC 34301]|nr:Haloacid dehalogenase-like hydrolase domain-containing protein 2 [Coemansia sp. BCRC 34301]
MSSRFTSIKGVLLDLSGTLHIDNTVTPGAVEALRLLRSTGINVRFVTNSTKTSDARLHAKLSKLGFDLSPSEIFTSLSAAKRLVQQRNYRPLLILEDEALEQFADVNQSPPHSAVVIGLAPSKLDYEHMNSAFATLLGGADLVGIHRAKYYASAEGQLSLGPGGFVAALEYAASKQAVLVGKPARAFYELALADMGLLESPENAVMVGDDVLADLGGGAQDLGMLRVLVKTGKYREGDEGKAEMPVDGVYCTFAGFVNAVVASARV